MKDQTPFIPGPLDDADLSVSVFRVFGHLCRRAGAKGVAWGSVSGIAKHCRINHETARSALQTVEKYGMVQRVNRPGRTSEFRIAKISAWKIPLGKKGIPPKHRGSPSETEVGHPSQTKVDKVYPCEGAATTAPAQGDQINIVTQTTDTGASAPAGAGVAPVSDQGWLPERLSLFHLRRVQMEVPSMAKLDLWQIADVYHPFQMSKRDYPIDIKDGRKDRPNLEPHAWFKEQVQSRKVAAWKHMVAQWNMSNDATKSFHFDIREKAQPENRRESDSWQVRLHELKEGRLNEVDFLYDDELKALPYPTWEKIPRWLKAMLHGNYLPGALPINTPSAARR